MKPYHVLLVDNPEEQVFIDAAALRLAEVEVAIEHQPEGVMAHLAIYRPDLILIGLDLLAAGTDLAATILSATIRQESNYIDIPIVYYATEERLTQRLEWLRGGSNDFLIRPIAMDLFVASVLIRCQRTRDLQQYMVYDSHTGLLNLTSLKERLELEVARARRLSTPLSFALLDIDQLATYEAPIGNQVLRGLANLLQSRLRKHDTIGRYENETLATILPGAYGDDAARLMNRLRASFEQVQFQELGLAKHASFSVGVADFAFHGSAPSLSHAASEALYVAKRSGFSCVHLAP